MAKDLYHDHVKHALEKDGWEITHDPYELRVGGVEMYRAVQRSQLKLLVYDLEKEIIEQWIK
ncbi:hypothetical protein PseudUWO311_17705 [Pseudanabaena sp. UWO311]|uniref:element excision factor XisH family protein n=1 Tax=Pseudanabaena sp. UWO311 TaxID=2487337 RepID=UPI0011583A43|nr:element excision factor XisH family protein [Pseudanabaena sp. UWO311]TYQ24850.1 hypothetical protein PseudUWO311_17705 [Pseudanabaena sp. UWO311]